ncbi:MAG: ATP-binding cassette domain-containing protein [Flammeovirgaceae bacterium]
MKIIANQVGKRFDREWVFRNFSFEFLAGNTYALNGPNGSGKSTLLQLLWGQLLPSKGMISYQKNAAILPAEEVFKHVSIATPYMDLIDEFSLEEMVTFHFQHKEPRANLTTPEAIDRMELPLARHKQIRDFSSGMRQRLKLALAFFSNCDVLFLDEPTTNLDRHAFDWYRHHLQVLPSNQLTIIASNQSEEYPATAQKINILEYR